MRKHKIEEERKGAGWYSRRISRILVRRPLPWCFVPSTYLGVVVAVVVVVVVVGAPTLISCPPNLLDIVPIFLSAAEYLCALPSVSHLAISPSPFSSPSLSPILSVRMARTVLEERQGRYVRDRLIRSYGFYHGNAVLSIDRGLILGQNNIVSPSLAYPPRCPLASSHTHTRTERERGSAPRPATQPVNRRTDHARLRTAARSVLWVRQYGGREPVRLAGLQQRPGCNIGISAMPYPFVSIKFNLAQRISKYRFTSFRCRWE